MVPNEPMKEIDNPCSSEKPVLVEDIRDSIARTNHAPPIPEWQKTELDKRYGSYKNGESKLHGWRNVHEKLRNGYQ
uniref:Putative addiction module component, TIGR02574 family n=1 Tax=Candidatus Kentrum sp. FW TaxID=2126338 RepID=A0A450TWK2_9GAMM|nr:MAG: putative addiction module component, TIGR02574 family [Candidatus Kentron sp. FW]